MVRKMMKNKRVMMAISIILLILIVLAIVHLNDSRMRMVDAERAAASPSGAEKVENFAPTIIVTPPAPASGEIQRGPKEVNALDRFWNPLRYPYRSDYFYDQRWYPDNNLPFQVIGGGRRMAPIIGGTEVPIANPSVPINIAEAPIAPINITTRGPRGLPQQLGVIYKVNGDHNTYLPLFGMKEYPNSDYYKYYTAMGNNSQVKVPLITKYKNQPLGDNDEVIIKGSPERYRVTLYESDFPQYVPYM